MMEAERKWVLYPWFEERGTEQIHPDDLEKFRSLKPYGLVFEDLGLEDDFHVLSYNGEKFRVRGDLIQKVNLKSDQVFKIGNPVGIKGTLEFGIISGISWHHKEGRPFYTIDVGGKKKSKRYWPEDLMRI
jgi:hypothetical protein